MIYLSIALGVFVLLAIVSGIAYARASYGNGDVAGFSCFISIVVAVILGLFVLILGVSRPVGRSTCANWQRQTGIRTKFVLLNAFDSGTCLARTPGGRWVQNTEWKAFVNGSK